MTEKRELVERMDAKVQKAFHRIDRILTKQAGCTADVKTIYVSYTLAGTMVAAAYPSKESFEIALALAEDHESPDLVDASHLTWSTLPVSLVISSESEAKAAEHLVNEAVERVRDETHDVHRDSDYFAPRSRRIYGD